MRRTTFSRLAAYFGDLVALTGAATLAVDLLNGGPALNQQTIADLSLVGAGLSAHRVTASRLREAPALALAFLVAGAAPSLLLLHRWWVAVAAAAAAAALAPHVLPPRRTRTWLAAATLLALSGVVDRTAVGAAGAMAVLVLGLVSRRLAADLRRRAAQAAQRREQALLIEQQRSADLVARLARYEGRAPARQSSALRVALSRRLGTIGAIASSLARELKQSAAGSAEAVPEAARRTIARAEELARLATGGSPREQEAALRLVWPQVCDALANRLQSTHHLDAEIPEDLPPLMGTALEWEHVLSAVVENALDAMPGGGVVRLRAGRSDRPGLARIVVEDTGPGTPGDLPDRAGRADQPGLATVAALLEGLGGELLFMPTEGRGARVTIESPFYSRPLEPRPEPVKLDGTVLLADDDPDARRGMAKLLQSLGLQVLEADNGTLALARLRNEAPRFRAAVLDVVMEGTPVGDIVAGIREIRPGFPVLLISGFETRRFVDSVMALGGVRYLGKPVPREELIAALQDLFAIDPGQPQGSGR